MENKCIFCKLAEMKENYIAETKNLFAVWDKYPVSKGHAMIIPKRHIVNMFEMNEEEGKELPLILNKVKEKIEKNAGSDKPKGYNIGSNNGEAAGQVVMHLHIHVIPRYKGGHGIQILGQGEPKE
ncbi:MAG: HIT family protein [Candidatus Micrarchaeia archaeon]